MRRQSATKNAEVRSRVHEELAKSRGRRQIGGKRRKSKRGPPETFAELVSPVVGKSREGYNCAPERQSVDGTSRGGKCWPKKREKRERSDERKGWEYDAGSRRVGGNGRGGHRKGSDDDRRGYVDHRNRRGVGEVSWR
jgi:hypothetical protein